MSDLNITDLTFNAEGLPTTSSPLTRAGALRIINQRLFGDSPSPVQGFFRN